MHKPVRNGSATRPLHVLVAEDNPVNQRVAVGLISRLGHTASVADDGQRAVEAVRDGDYDLVFMDIHMPVMDGYAATRAIRALDGAKARTPVIAMTAKALDGDREVCLEAGMDDYVAKPVRQDALARVFERWGSGPDAPADSGPAAGPDSEPRIPPLYDAAVKAEVLSVAGTDGFAELLATALETAARQLADIRAAHAAGRADEARRIVHSLRGAAENLGMTALAGAAAEIEVLCDRPDTAALDEAAVRVPALLARYRDAR